jgi:hypothetical protein
LSNTKVLRWVFAGFALILLIMAFWVFGVGGFLRSTADFRGETGKRENVEADGAYRVAQHDYFYNLCSSAKTKQDNIEILKGTGNKDAVTANRLELNKLVNKYNADASNTYTKGQFRADNLPYQLDAEEEIECGTA